MPETLAVPLLACVVLRKLTFEEDLSGTLEIPFRATALRRILFYRNKEVSFSNVATHRYKRTFTTRYGSNFGIGIGERRHFCERRWGRETRELYDKSLYFKGAFAALSIPTVIFKLTVDPMF